MIISTNASSCLCVGERVVDVGGVGCPCGGTHVKNTADIKSVTVTKIKKVWPTLRKPGGGGRV